MVAPCKKQQPTTIAGRLDWPPPPGKLDADALCGADDQNISSMQQHQQAASAVHYWMLVGRRSVRASQGHVDC